MKRKNKLLLLFIVGLIDISLIAGIFVYRYKGYDFIERALGVEEEVEEVIEEEIVEEEVFILEIVEPEMEEVVVRTNTAAPWYRVDVYDSELIYAPPAGRKGYRYGPSIIKYKNGLMDMWMSRPGNNSTQWDYIAYRHYNLDDWLEEEVVLAPTPGSKDQCSCCDPGLVYIDGYYYLGYTGTANYAMEGMDNSVFVARSKSPNGPYEKWNGSSWGGNPEPMIPFTGNPAMWGIGEVSFVAVEDTLYIYYTYSDEFGIFTKLCTADICENWPATIQYHGAVSRRSTEDSYDVVYAEDLDNFLAFSIGDRMCESSYLKVFWSYSGYEFSTAAESKAGIPNFAHNLGIIRDEKGHINTSEMQTIGYAYGAEWGAWPMILQEIKLNRAY